MRYTREFIERKVSKKYHYMIDFEATIEIQDGLFLIENEEKKRNGQARFHINEAPSNWNWYVKRIHDNPSFDW